MKTVVTRDRKVQTCLEFHWMECIPLIRIPPISVVFICLPRVGTSCSFVISGSVILYNDVKQKYYRFVTPYRVINRMLISWCVLWYPYFQFLLVCILPFCTYPFVVLPIKKCICFYAKTWITAPRSWFAFVLLPTAKLQWINSPIQRWEGLQLSTNANGWIRRDRKLLWGWTVNVPGWKSVLGILACYELDLMLTPGLTASNFFSFPVRATAGRHCVFIPRLRTFCSYPIAKYAHLLWLPTIFVYRSSIWVVSIPIALRWIIWIHTSS